MAEAGTQLAGGVGCGDLNEALMLMCNYVTELLTEPSPQPRVKLLTSINQDPEEGSKLV